MPDADITNENKPCSPDDVEELKSYKYLLGDFGVLMLVAIARGAGDNESIQMLSGVPHACITGRLPVLLNLALIETNSSCHYHITAKGRNFLSCINEFV